MLVWKKGQVMCTRLMPGDRLWCNLTDGTFRFFRPVAKGQGIADGGMSLEPLYRATPDIGVPFDTLYLKQPNRGILSDAELTDIVDLIAAAAGLEAKSAQWQNTDRFDRWFIFDVNPHAVKIMERLNAECSPLMDGTFEGHTAGP